MKKINYIFITLIFSSLMILSSCGDFLDVNDNPTQIADAGLPGLLSATIERTSKAHYNAMQYSNRVTHQLDHVGGYYGSSSMSSNWTVSYLSALNNLRVIQNKSGDSPHYDGVAKVLEAIHVAMLTDIYEAAPYSEGLQGSNNVSPTYDSQESLYNAVMSLLDASISLMETSESFLTPGSDDLVYGGDMTKWIKLAHSLKARTMLHLSNKSNVNWTNIAAEAALGITSNDDNFSFNYNEVNINPIHSLALANLTGNLTLTFGKMYIDDLNGTTYGVVDPRLSLIAHTDSLNYVGLANYDDNAPDHTTEIGVDGWYSSASSPIVMFSAAENYFIMAEAGLNGAGDADAAYRNGITAHMDMLGVDDASKTAYLDDASVNVTADLEHIMKEKYIANIFNMETWNDMRRYNFDENIFKGFVNVNSSNNPEVERLGPAQRATYPTTEFSRNGENAMLNAKDIDVKMWKDQ